MSFKALSDYARRQALDRGHGFTFSADQLTAIFAREFPDEEADDITDLSRKVHERIKIWCFIHVRGQYEFTWPTFNNFRIQFADKREAMRFKLTWMGT